MEVIKVNFKYEEKEYIQANRQYLLASKTIKKSDFFIAILMFLIALVCIFLPTLSLLGGVLIVCAFFFLFVLGIAYFVTPILTFKQNIKYKEEYRFGFSDRGIRFETDTIHSDLQWNVYTDFLENESFYYLIQSKRVYSIIPKRAFADNAARKHFNEMVMLKVIQAEL